MTVEIPLTRGYVAIVDDEDADLAALRWRATNVGNTVYAIRQVPSAPKKRRTVYMHRVILERKLGRAPQPEELTDHKSGDGLDNRRSNIRLSDRGLNKANHRNAKRRDGMLTGVTLVKPRERRYRAQIRYSEDGVFKQTHLGYYASVEDAHAAFKRAHVERYGEFSPYYPNGESDAGQKISLDKEPPRLRSASPEGDVEDVGGENLEQYETAVTSQEIGVNS